MNAPQLADDAVLLQVPLHYAAQVAAYRDDLVAGRVETDSVGDVAPTVEVKGYGSWTEDMVTQLLDELPYEGVIVLFDLCASRGGEWVQKAEAEKNGNVTPVQLRNELGALSKTTKRIFGEINWPVEWKKEKAIYRYRMDPVMAGWWQSARTGVGK